MSRVILHCDLNNFFATVECKKQPELFEKPVAVCGNTAERHGIVLAKNYEAKKYGIITGEAVVAARRKCPALVIIPPNYDEYAEYSNQVRKIYYRYTDLVEPFGIDECWLDVTGSTALFGSGETIAYSIKETVKSETGLTVSIGVSYNKILAKLGSDIKKPDAITCIYKDEVEDKIWSLPVAMLMGIGHSTERSLRKHCINTIGELAVCTPELLEYWFGKNGLQLWVNANGLDSSPVMPYDYAAPIKSVGHGTTTVEDLKEYDEVSDIILELSQSVGTRLRSNHLTAAGVAVSVRDNRLAVREYQGKLAFPSQSSGVIADRAKELFRQNYDWHAAIRSVTVRAINLNPENYPKQMNLFTDYQRQCRLEQLDKAIDSMRSKYGEHTIHSASYLKNIKIVKENIAKPLDKTVYM